MVELERQGIGSRVRGSRELREKLLFRKRSLEVGDCRSRAVSDEDRYQMVHGNATCNDKMETTQMTEFK